jgi:soluble lytic murein transglycosylase-like protein
LKIKQNIAEMCKLLGRAKQQATPVSRKKTDFASLMARFNKPQEPRASQESQSRSTLTLQDYRVQALPVRIRAQKQKAAYEALINSGDSDLKVPGGLQQVIDEAARKHQLPVKLLTAIIKVESNFNPRAVSSEGASGLMQLMPSTARKLGVTNIFDIKQNIDGGSRYLKKMLDRYEGKLELALAAYNAGPGAVDKHGGVPPYQETRNYVKKVMAHC